MGKDLLKAVTGALLIFLLTNLLFPETFQGTIFAGMVSGYGSANPELQQLYYVLEPGEERQVLDSLSLELSGRLIKLDSGGQVLENSEAVFAKRVGFSDYSEGAAVVGSRVVKIRILPPDKYQRYPVSFAFFRVAEAQRFEQMSNWAVVNVVAGSDDAQTAKTIGELLAHAN